ncbi:MAG: hypothetical protein Q8Q74_14415, partial [Polaromonas sp.]|nr:hypothetical protein [Polaromonas sp.]
LLKKWSDWRDPRRDWTIMRRRLDIARREDKPAMGSRDGLVPGKKSIMIHHHLAHRPTYWKKP